MLRSNLAPNGPILGGPAVKILGGGGAKHTLALLLRFWGGAWPPCPLVPACAYGLRKTGFLDHSPIGVIVVLYYHKQKLSSSILCTGHLMQKFHSLIAALDMLGMLSCQGTRCVNISTITAVPLRISIHVSANVWITNMFTKTTTLQVVNLFNIYVGSFIIHFCRCNLARAVSVSASLDLNSKYVTQ